MGLCLVLDVIREQGNSILEYLKNSYLGGRNNGVKPIKAVIMKQQSLLLVRIRRFLVIFVVWTIVMIFSMFRNEYE